MNDKLNDILEHFQKDPNTTYGMSYGEADKAFADLAKTMEVTIHNAVMWWCDANKLKVGSNNSYHEYYFTKLT